MLFYVRPTPLARRHGLPRIRISTVPRRSTHCESPRTVGRRTGYPATGIISVSVFAKQTEIADALATGIFVLGIEVGIDLVNQLKGIECIIVDEKGKIHTSKGIDIKKYNTK